MYYEEKEFVKQRMKDFEKEAANSRFVRIRKDKNKRANKQRK